MGSIMGGRKAMKIYFFTRRTMLAAAAIFILLCGFLGLSLIYFNDAGIALHSREPIYQGNTGQKVVALTVNVDWGEEYIPAMLQEFKKYDARVTFFVTGRWAEKNPELLKEMSKAGHSIQNHGYKHLHFNQLAPAQTEEQIKKAEKIIKEITGKQCRFLASPYGEQGKQLMQVVSSLDYDLIMWSIDTIDWQRPSPDTIVKRVLNRLHNDAIVLMHPTEPTVKALPEMLKGLKEQGYKMVGIEDIIKDGKLTDEKSE